MSRRQLVSALLVAVAVLAFARVALAAESQSGITVTVDRAAISTELGRKFVLRTTISNRGSAVAENMVAHLNVLSFRSDVYVDPEDWSSSRTRYLQPILAGGSVTLTWNLQAVNSGSIGVFVAVLPKSGALRPVSSPTVDVSIARRQTLNSGGILPLALGIPAGLGALAIGIRLARRRRLQPA